MSTFSIHTQKTRTGHRLVLVSPSNQKLVLNGESIRRLVDAEKVKQEILHGTIVSGDALPLGHRFPKNAGPKKKKPSTK